MSKILLFVGLTWLLGNPFLAIIVILVLLYVAERRLIGLSPSFVKPFRRRGAISKWRRQLSLSPHDVSAKSELARLLIESKRFGEAREILIGIQDKMEHSAEFWSDLGTCELALGHWREGEEGMNRALAISPRVKYGQPYLRLAEAIAKRDPSGAIAYLERFKEVNSSSCEAFYRLGAAYDAMGDRQQAATAYAECRRLYRSLPKYMKRHERKWAIRGWLRTLKK
ncbi:tetratricopeptide repeat protein [Cohnella suwonensis]|uniref:Tetratricopeptide repeat protein n=1 Tax=Cohnella suwonensis TaxID=696072 RepID=A0ABW0LVC0_9BACL